MIHEIILPNRDGANLKLVSQDGKCWGFQVDESHKYVLEYMRIAYENDNKTIYFIDPSGGPMIIRNHYLFDTHYFVDAIIFDDNDKLQLFLSEK